MDWLMDELDNKANVGSKIKVNIGQSLVTM